MKSLLTGFDLTLLKLPLGTEVQMQVSMNGKHTQTEIMDTNDQNQEGAPPVREEDRKDMAMTNFAMVDEEQEEDEQDKDFIEELHSQSPARLENQESEDKKSNTSPIKRMREDSSASNSSSQQIISSKSKTKSGSAIVKQPKKK